MKKTQFLELFQLINKTKVSFIAIALFMCLGLALFTGLKWGGLAFSKSVVCDMSDHRFMNFECMSSVGFDEATVEDIKKIDGVDYAEGSYVSSQFCILNGNQIQAKVIQITSEVNLLFRVEGHLPTKADEIVVEKTWAEKNNIQLGDKISFVRKQENSHFLYHLLREDAESLICDKEGTTVMPGLLNDNFIVTAFAESPQYIATSSGTYGTPSPKTMVPYSCLMFVSKQAFDRKSAGGYPYIHVYSKLFEGLDYNSEQYKSIEHQLMDRLQPVLDQCTNKKKQTIKTASNHIVEEIEGKLSDSRYELADAKKKAQDFEKKIQSKQDELAEAEQTLAGRKKEVNKGSKELEKRRTWLDKEWALYAEKEAQLDQKEPDEKIEYQQYLSSIKAQLEGYEAELTKRKQELSAAQQFIRNEEEKIRNGRETIKNSQEKLDNGKKDLAKKITEYELNEKKLKDLKDLLTSLNDVGFSVTTRADNSALYSIRCVLSIYEKFSFSFAAVFLLIGLLICYSTISQIVYHSTKQIGVKKAMGMTKSEIAPYFLMYGGSASLLGALMGLLLSRFVFEDLFMFTNKLLYFVDSSEKHFDWMMSIIAIIAETLLSLATAYLACRKLNKEKPITLINDDKIKAGRVRFFEKWTIWKKSPLLCKTIVNNCLNDKRRVFDTLFGIIGCTTLIVAALTVSHNLDAGFARQFNKLQSFDTIVYYDLTNDSDRQHIADILDKNDVDYANAHFSMGSIKLKDAGVRCYSYIIATDDVRIKDMVNLYEDGSRKENDGNGIWLPISMNNAYGVKSGDKVTYTDPDGHNYEFPVSGTYEYYLPRYQTLVNKSTYEKITGTQLRYNAFLLNTGLKGIPELTDELMEIDGYISTENYYEQIRDVWDSLGFALKAVVWVCLILAVIQAFFVILNLFTMFVDEKKDELIVMMINGYSRKDAKKYIYWDNAVMGFIGIPIGVVLGSLMGNWILILISTDQNYYFRGISWPSIGLGVAVSIIILFTMSTIALSKVKHFKYSDVNS